VSKRYIVGHPSSRKRAKKYWSVYYYDEFGKFHSKRISFMQVLYYKSKKKYKIQSVVCPQCDENYKIVGVGICPNCEIEI